MTVLHVRQWFFLETAITQIHCIVVVFRPSNLFSHFFFLPSFICVK